MVYRYSKEDRSGKSRASEAKNKKGQLMSYPSTPDYDTLLIPTKENQHEDLCFEV